MRRLFHDKKVLWTTGEIRLVRSNRHHISDIYQCVVWVHDGLILKNHTDLSEHILNFIKNRDNFGFIRDNTTEWMDLVNMPHYVMTPHKFV